MDSSARNSDHVVGMIDPIGTVVAGRYRIRAEIGAGGMGKVYEGVETAARRKVAIKIVSSDQGATAEGIARFQRECRAVRRLESVHCVQVLDAGADPELGFYLVMEFLEGIDLAKLLAERGRLEVDEALSIAQQIARGLARAHAAGVVHRDLKPANIFLVDMGDDLPHAKIVDFGVSKIFDDDLRQSALTKSGRVIGTLQYMSPEQARGSEIDERTDIWSLGAVLYEMLAGEPPFKVDISFEQTLLDLVSGKTKPLQAVRPDLTPEVIDLVNSALEPDRDKRTPSARMMAKLINAVLGLRTGESAAIRLRRSAHGGDTMPPTQRAPARLIPGEEDHDLAVEPTITASSSGQKVARPFDPPPDEATQVMTADELLRAGIRNRDVEVSDDDEDRPPTRSEVEQARVMLRESARLADTRARSMTVVPPTRAKNRWLWVGLAAIAAFAAALLIAMKLKK